MKELETEVDVSDRGCPFSQLSDPYQLPNEQLETLYKKARNEGPVTYLSDIGYWAVTKYTDIKSILGDKEKFSSEITQEPLTPYAPEVLRLFKARNFSPRPTLSNNEREDHGRIRRNTQIAALYRWHVDFAPAKFILTVPPITSTLLSVAISNRVTDANLATRGCMSLLRSSRSSCRLRMGL